jgi:hypothetical protein
MDVTGHSPPAVDSRELGKAPGVSAGEDEGRLRRVRGGQNATTEKRSNGGRTKALVLV